MSLLGDRLRQCREAQGISLAQAAAETRILQRYLAALESGEFQHLPGDVYARGFIRNYSLYLGMSADECIEIYRRERGATAQIRVVPTSRLPRIQGCLLPSSFTVFFIVIALISATYFYMNVNGMLTSAPSREVLGPTTVPATPAPLPTSTVTPMLAVGVAPSLVPTPLVRPTQRPSPTLSAPVVVEVRVKPGRHAGSWMLVETDGGQAFQGTMEAGDAQVFEAQNQVTIRAGNAGVVEVIVNGQPPLTLGQREGQVVDWSFPP